MNRLRLFALVKKWIPPVMFNSTYSFYKRIKPRRVSNSLKQKDAKWYNDSFKGNERYHAHYTNSHYYFLWSVIGYHLLNREPVNILDVGCGPGQFAMFLKDIGITNYVGLDFSTERITHAKINMPNSKFVVADAFKSDLIKDITFDTIVCMEFLEHVNEDLKFIKRLNEGVHFIGTVPNFPYFSHVRHFKDSKEVIKRYASFFDNFSLITLKSDVHNQQYYLFSGNMRKEDYDS